MADASLSFPPRIAPVSFEAANVLALTHVELDALPFGVICLDVTGKVLRYNLAEARMARLDRAQVLGRDFFKTIAPCTATVSFEGRVKAFFKSTQRSDQFSYLFDFKFGAQHVDIELLRSKDNSSVFLLVNRKKFVSPRVGLPAGTVAPAQADLAPHEAALGVERDAVARRMLAVDGNFITALHQTWIKVAPTAWPGFTREWGWQWGRHAVVDLEASLLEERMLTLRELSMREAMDRVRDWISRRGLGSVTFDFATSVHGLFEIRVERSAIGESVGLAEVPRCHLFEGLFEAVCEHLSHRLLAVREVHCCAQGFSSCVFAVASERRRKELEQAIAKGAEDMHGVVGALRGSP